MWMPIALTHLLLKAPNVFSRFHSAVIHLMLQLLLIYPDSKTRQLLNQLWRLMHPPYGMLKRHVMPSHFKRIQLPFKRFLVHSHSLHYEVANMLLEPIPWDTAT